MEKLEKQLKKKLIVTGHTSEIFNKFIDILYQVSKLKSLEIIRCGRDKNADFKLDFSQYRSLKKFNDFLKKKKPNYIFLNHGYLCGKKIKFMSKDQLERTIYVNLVSYVSVLEQIKSLKKCKTVVKSSISGSAGSYDNLYASTKAGINLISKKITSQIDRNSRINLISPGIVKMLK